MPDDKRHVSYRFLDKDDLWYGYGFFDIDEEVTDRLHNTIKWAFRSREVAKVTIEYSDGSGYTFQPTETIEETDKIMAMGWKI